MYVKENKGEKKDTCQFAVELTKIFSISVCASKGEFIETTN
jgi:hypothetical protein